MILRFVFSGTGGQGVISAAIILGESALFHGGLSAVQTQVYGPEARGGSARSDLILADHEILFPKVLQPNVLVCLSQAAYDSYSSNVRPGGVVVTDSRLVRRWQHASSREIELPLHDTVTRELGTAQSINICLLGALVRLIPVVGVDAVAAVVTGRFPARFKNANLAALELGAGLVTESITTF